MFYFTIKKKNYPEKNMDNVLKTLHFAGYSQLTPVIPATWEAEIGEWWFKASLGKSW
jgi:hypothetical protein